MSARMLINGVEVEGAFGRIEFDGKRLEHDKPKPSAAIGVTRGSYVIDVEGTAAEQLETFLEALAPRESARPEGILTGKGNASTASFVTLGKRYFYGGRKARSAKRRMIAGVFGPTRVTLQPTEHAALAFACPYPFQKAKE